MQIAQNPPFLFVDIFLADAIVCCAFSFCAYLSQLERGVRTNPSTELLDKIAMVLCLNKIETETLYDLYAKVSRQISPDIAVYISSSETVQQALRTARDANATEEDWKQFIEQLNK